jgi:hypothetical protein
MSSLVRLAVLAALSTGLVACKSTREAHYGSGPLTLSPGVQAAFEQYLQTMTPGMFLVTIDGTATYYIYCEESDCYDSISMFAIQSCEAKFARPCKIYADGRGIVWRADAAAVKK